MHLHHSFLAMSLTSAILGDRARFGLETVISTAGIVQPGSCESPRSTICTYHTLSVFTVSLSHPILLKTWEAVPAAGVAEEFKLRAPKDSSVSAAGETDFGGDIFDGVAGVETDLQRQFTPGMMDA